MPAVRPRASFLGSLALTSTLLVNMFLNPSPPPSPPPVAFEVIVETSIISSYYKIFSILLNQKGFVAFVVVPILLFTVYTLAFVTHATYLRISNRTVKTRWIPLTYEVISFIISNLDFVEVLAEVHVPHMIPVFDSLDFVVFGAVLFLHLSALFASFRSLPFDKRIAVNALLHQTIVLVFSHQVDYSSFTTTFNAVVEKLTSLDSSMFAPVFIVIHTNEVEAGSTSTVSLVTITAEDKLITYQILTIIVSSFDEDTTDDEETLSSLDSSNAYSDSEDEVVEYIQDDEEDDDAAIEGYDNLRQVNGPTVTFTDVFKHEFIDSHATEFLLSTRQQLIARSVEYVNSITACSEPTSSYDDTNKFESSKHEITVDASLDDLELLFSRL